MEICLETLDNLRQVVNCGDSYQRRVVRAMLVDDGKGGLTNLATPGGESEGWMEAREYLYTPRTDPEGRPIYRERLVCHIHRPVPAPPQVC